MGAVSSSVLVSLPLNVLKAIWFLLKGRVCLMLHSSGTTSSPPTDIADARSWVWRYAVAYALQLLVVLLVVFSALHMVNIYPRFYTPAVLHRDEALAFVELCETHPSIRYARRAACAEAHSDASVNVRLVALEQTFGEFAHHFNILSPLFKDTRFSYVLLRSADNLLSSSVMLLLCVLLLLLWLAWSLSAGPVRMYRWYHMLHQQQTPLLHEDHSVYPEAAFMSLQQQLTHRKTNWPAVAGNDSSRAYTFTDS
jgi:hypothetical protein